MKVMRGFTLIEIMVALLILTLMGAAAVAGLHHMIRAREKQMAHQERYMALTQAYAILSQDVFYAKLDAVENRNIHFSRRMMNEQGDVEVVDVAYQWDDHEIRRIVSGRETVLLSGVNHLEVSVFTAGLTWQPLDSYVSDGHLPLGIRYVFHDAAMGDLTWSYALPH